MILDIHTHNFSGAADTVALLSADVGPGIDLSGDPFGATPKERFQKLRDEIRRRQLPFAEIRTRWAGPGGRDLETAALAVRGLSLDEAVALAAMFRQEQFVFRTATACLVVRPLPPAATEAPPEGAQGGIAKGANRG